MIGNKIFQIEYAAKKLYQAGAVFPIDRQDAAYDIAAIVKSNIWITSIEMDDNFPGTIVTKHNLEKVLDGIVYDCQFVYGKPVIAIFDEDDDCIYYVVYDAEQTDSVWPK